MPAYVGTGLLFASNGTMPTATGIPRGTFGGNWKAKWVATAGAATLVLAVPVSDAFTLSVAVTL